MKPGYPIRLLADSRHLPTRAAVLERFARLLAHEDFETTFAPVPEPVLKSPAGTLLRVRAVSREELDFDEQWEEPTVPIQDGPRATRGGTLLRVPAVSRQALPGGEVDFDSWEEPTEPVWTGSVSGRSGTLLRVPAIGAEERWEDPRAADPGPHAVDPSAPTYLDLPALGSSTDEYAAIDEADLDGALAVARTAEYAVLDGPEELFARRTGACAPDDPSERPTILSLPAVGHEALREDAAGLHGAPTRELLPAARDRTLGYEEQGAGELHGAPTVECLPSLSDEPEGEPSWASAVWGGDPEPSPPEPPGHPDEHEQPAWPGRKGRRVRVTNWFMAAENPEILAEAEGEAKDFVDAELMSSRYAAREVLPDAVRKGFSLEDDTDEDAGG